LVCENWILKSFSLKSRREDRSNMAVPVAPAAALPAGIGQLVAQINAGFAQQAQHEQVRLYRDDLREQISRIRACEGSVAADVREWIAEVELVIPQMSAALGAMIEVGHVASKWRDKNKGNM
jgi:hypothetical protein